MLFRTTKKPAKGPGWSFTFLSRSILQQKQYSKGKTHTEQNKMRQKAWVSQQRRSGPGQSRAGCGLHILNSLSDIPNWDSAVGLTPPLFWHPTPQAKMFGFNNCSTKLYYEEWSWLSLKPQLLPAGEVSWGITLSSSSSDVRHTGMSFPGSPSYLILCGLSVAFGMAHHSPWFQGLSFWLSALPS